MSKADDLSAARALVGGYVEEDAKGRLRSKYLRPGSREERDARQALARVLRDDALDRQMRHQLADLFDPPPSADRKLEFVNQRPGRHADPVARTQIAEYIYAQARAGTVTKAIEAAILKFEVSEELAKKIWGSYRPLLESIYGPLARTSRRKK
jgi:hypothetical protein